MEYIDLNNITESHVIGKWNVESRVVNQHSYNNAFSHAAVFEIDHSSFKSKNGRELKGKWQVIREKEIIYNPQLKFLLESQQSGNAIITKLVNIVENNIKTEKMTLYFNDGLELVLRKSNL